MRGLLASSRGETGRRSPLTALLAVGFLLVAVVALVALVGLFGEVLGGETGGFDEAALVWMAAGLPGWLDGPLRAVTALGYYRVVVPLLVVVASVLYLRRSKLSAVFLVASTCGTMVLTTALKAAFGRERPDLPGSGYEASFYSFPSGHAAVAVGFYGVLAVIGASRLRGLRRWLVAAAAALFVLLMGLSRLYLGAHYPTDVAAGYLLAVVWSGAVGGACLAHRRARGGGPSAFSKR